MHNTLFRNIAGIGDLDLVEIFMDYEGEPIIFSLADSDKNLYIALCSEIRGHQKWLISPLDRKDSLLLKPLRDFFIGTTIHMVEMDAKGIEKSWVTTKPDELDLPEEGVYIDI